MPVRILIADDHEVVRIGLRSLFVGTEVEVVAEVGTGVAALEAGLTQDLDLVLLDVRLPGGDGLRVLSRLKDEKPELAVLMISTYDNATYMARSVALGANGYFLKDVGKGNFIGCRYQGGRGRNGLAA